MDNSRQILVVDDDEAIRELVKDLFTEAGYAVALAADAEAALELLDTGQINVMFLDLNLPGMSGVDLCRKIRETNPVACIYSMTGHASLFELTDCREAGFDDIFLKPVNMDMFLSTARGAFERLERWQRR